MSAKHTPTPWMNQDFVICGPDNKPIGVMQTWATDSRPYEVNGWANAELLVRAVNSHEALLQALKKVIEMLSWMEDHSPAKASDLVAVVECFSLVKKAIAKAEAADK